jgi:hypothetical protein
MSPTSFDVERCGEDNANPLTRGRHTAPRNHGLRMIVLESLAIALLALTGVIRTAAQAEQPHA